MDVAHSDPYVQRPNGFRTALIVGGVLLCLMVGFSIGSGRGIAGLFSLLGSRGQDPTLVGAVPRGFAAEAVGGIQQPATQLGMQPNDPTIQSIDKMPFEVRQWLKHLEETERRRKALATRHLASLLTQSALTEAGMLKDLIAEGMGGESAGDSDTSPKVGQVETSAASARKEWVELNQFFNSVPPPLECLPTKNAYDQCLGETSAMVNEVLEAIVVSRDDPQAAVQSLYEMMGTSEGRIDEAAKQTDGLVAGICKKYETFKWFSISGDFGGGLSGIGGAGLGF